MPWDPSRYPADWKQIRQRILARDGNCCRTCGVANGSIGYRDVDDEWQEFGRAQDGDKVSDFSYPDGDMKFIRIVLTIAHINPDPMDCRDENLLAECQRCHLRRDAAMHGKNAAQTRRRKWETENRENGQQMIRFETPLRP